LMTKLVEALEELGSAGEILLSGRWIRLKGVQCSVYVAETIWNVQYCTWCDHPKLRSVEFYSDPIEAIQAGLRRADTFQGSK
jgi:hypothetical protein